MKNNEIIGIGKSKMTEANNPNYNNVDVELFAHNLGIAIYDLNKKHNNVLYRTNLGNALTPFIMFMNKIKKNRDEKEQNDK